jgi:cobalt-zinc-cadmium efflux system membrane fusion protein
VPPELETPVIEPPAVHNAPPVPAPSRFRDGLRHLLSAVLTVGCVAALVALGQATGWKLTREASPWSDAGAGADDWCEEHSVPESACVECRPDLLPRGRSYKWCSEHGIPECPLCHPELAQLPSQPKVTDEDRARAARSLAFAPRIENDDKCVRHERRLQLASDEIAARLGVKFAPAGRATVTETVEAPGEIIYDPTRIARATPRAAGIVWRVEKQIGDTVRKGDVLALIDSAAVGKAKAEFQQSLVRLDLRKQTLARVRPLGGRTVPEKDVLEAQAAAEEVEVRVLTAEQALANLGLPVRADDVRALSAPELAARVQFLGMPDSLAKELAGRTGSSNLLPVFAPLDGTVVARSAVEGEEASLVNPLFVVADTSRMWLVLRLRPEDAGRVRPGQRVEFQHTANTGRVECDPGTVAWISPSADERTRTVPVRVELPNTHDRHHANTFGTARVVLREEPGALVVPSAAVHWDGCCSVVFVRDRDYEKPGAAKVVHVRKVRPGAKDVPTAAGPVTEVAVGLLPGEWVATTNSGIFRSELLKNDLGEG